MNAYTTKTQARIRQRDVDAILRTHSFRAGASLAAFEHQRGWQAEAEVNRLLRRQEDRPAVPASVVATLRQAMGGALVRAGERFLGVPRNGGSLADPAAASLPGTAD
jgi:hypothetical protein